MRWGLKFSDNTLYYFTLYPIHHLYESHNSTEVFTHDRDLYPSYKL